MIAYECQVQVSFNPFIRRNTSLSIPFAHEWMCVKLCVSVICGMFGCVVRIQFSRRCHSLVYPFIWVMVKVTQCVFLPRYYPPLRVSLSCAESVPPSSSSFRAVCRSSTPFFCSVFLSGKSSEDLSVWLKGSQQGGNLNEVNSGTYFDSQWNACLFLSIIFTANSPQFILSGMWWLTVGIAQLLGKT